MTAESRAIEALLVKRATEGLKDDERIELKRLMRAASVPDTDAFERAAAAIHAGRVEASARLPEGLRQRLERQGIEYLASKDA
jgi:hypothetical protein